MEVNSIPPPWAVFDHRPVSGVSPLHAFRPIIRNFKPMGISPNKPGAQSHGRIRSGGSFTIGIIFLEHPRLYCSREGMRIVSRVNYQLYSSHRQFSHTSKAQSDGWGPRHSFCISRSLPAHSRPESDDARNQESPTAWLSLESVIESGFGTKEKESSKFLTPFVYLSAESAPGGGIRPRVILYHPHTTTPVMSGACHRDQRLSQICAQSTQWRVASADIREDIRLSHVRAFFAR